MDIYEVAASLLWLALLVVWVAVLVCIYMLPTVVAVRRRVRNVGSVVVINIFLGWTFIGWVVALAMAVRSLDSRTGS